MALAEPSKFAGAVLFTGLLSFIFGIIAENKKPSGDMATKLINPIGGITCQYPSDPTIVLGSLAAIFLCISAIIALISLIYPYEGKGITMIALAKSKGLVTFVVLSVILFFVAEALLLWATVLESVHRNDNQHLMLEGSCPTAKAGLFGGAAFMALDSTLFWMICLMLAVNARADHFGYTQEDAKGVYEDVTGASEYAPGIGGQHLTAKV